MSAGYRERWTIPGPGPDESVASIIERADRYYNGKLLGLGRVLDARPSSAGKGDDIAPLSLSMTDVWSVAKRIDVPAGKLFAHRVPLGPEWLDPLQRRAFCAGCWAEDDRRGRPRAFRRTWAGIWCLSCPVHGMPLSWCYGDPQLESLGGALAFWARDSTNLQLIAFLDQLERLMILCATRPRFKASVRLMVAVLSSNWAPFPGPTLLEGMQFASVSEYWLVPLRRRNSPALRSPNDALLRLGHPGARRAVLGVLAMGLEPRIGPLLPMGLPYRPFEAWDATWQHISPRYARRQRRFYYHLRAVAAAWWGPNHVPPHETVHVPIERQAWRQSPAARAQGLDGGGQ